MKRYSIFIFVILFLTNCQKAEVPSVKDLISKLWKAQTVRENSTVVFSLNASTNIRPTYANFRLDLRDATKAIYIDLDGRTTTGTWKLVAENRIVLENLNPAPSSTAGTIEFFLTTTPTPQLLEVFRDSESKKTGNTRNEYVLIPE